ncbi:MAG: endopeptidase La [Elusimicrobia bacterium]|nr:endopeptidase La [Elusimicrobiota bacterium]
MSPDFKQPPRLPLLAVRDVVVFPHMVLPLSVGRPKSVKALEAAMQAGKLLGVVAQKVSHIEDPQVGDLFSVGVLAEVVQYLRMPDSTLKVFLQGHCRIAAGQMAFSAEKGYWESDLSYPEPPVTAVTPEIKALMRHSIELFEEHAKLARKANMEGLANLYQIEEPSRLADLIAANSLVKTTDRQSVLETFDCSARLLKIGELLKAEIEIMNLERKIHTRVKTQIEKSQKEYYLTEQMKAIQKELRQKDDFAKEIEDLRKSVKDAGMPKEADEASQKEVGRLEKMMPYSPEATVARTYLDWMIHLPWAKRTRDNLDLKRAHEILEADHYDLRKAKDRVLEYLAVCKLTRRLKGPILCFVGPPGVGKTSLGRSIARALGRKFVRMSLGGVRDEAEIRGHRRTYIGSLPGRIIQSLRKAGSKNPLFLLDEIDKMGMDWRGDPAAALLEVLDPEQNHTFMDHYLDVEFDLSQVMFVCTANTLEGIPVSLQDRLETLRFSGYTHHEKRLIAKTYLWPKQQKEHGLKEGRVIMDDAGIDRAIEEYTREAGVRSLEREMASVARKAAKKIVEDAPDVIRVAADNLHEFLGIPKFFKEKNSFNAVGVSTGLAWTEVGGVTMAIEVVAVPGKGELRLTGKLGAVMSESAQAALSHVKSISARLGAGPEAFKDIDYHLHVPEGATPKDGPSAGIAIAAALASLVSGRPVKAGLAMTGEITLKGRVLPIGGLKEKILAAHREGIHTVLYPDQNKKDLEDIPAEILSDLTLVPVHAIDEVFDLALDPAPAQAQQAPAAQAKPAARSQSAVYKPEPPPVSPSVSPSVENLS